MNNKLSPRDLRRGLRAFYETVVDPIGTDPEGRIEHAMTHGLRFSTLDTAERLARAGLSLSEVLFKSNGDSASLVGYTPSLALHIASSWRAWRAMQ